MTQESNSERNAGLLLVAAAAAAMALANSPLAPGWHALLEAPLGLRLPRIGILTVHNAVADGLMALFFLLVGLEVKREWFEGRLASAADRRLPILAAIAGMAVPSLIFLAIAGGDRLLAKGWAIPAATDIAFAVGVLALLGSRAPPSIKLLLVTIAIVDDVGAVLIIALFYTAQLDVSALAAALGVAGALAALGLFGVRRLAPFLFGGAAIWLLVLSSGIHPTIAGVLVALTVPLGRGEPHSPLKHLEHALHPWVMFGVMPLFALVAAGVDLGGGASLASPLPLAIVAGLFVGKQLGIYGAIQLAVRTRMAAMPSGATSRHLYGAALLCGIGFTMSLFIGALAFPAEPLLAEGARLGTIVGSLLSGILGFVVLRTAPAVVIDARDEAFAGQVFAAHHRDDPSG
jgi:NhaA family Na+:H+ antiporter